MSFVRTSLVSSILPLAVLGGLSGLLLVDRTESIGVWLLEENHPVELLSSLGALLAAVVSFTVLRRPHVTSGLARGFFVVFGAAMFFLAMEEISWGQQFLDFSTPEPWRARNRQDELTLHNYDFRGVEFLEIYPLTFAIGGLVGVVLGATNVLPQEISPPVWMWPWFGVIAAHSGVDLLHEFVIPSTRLDDLVNDLDEASEMLVAFSALTFVIAKRRPTLAHRSEPSRGRRALGISRR